MIPCQPSFLIYIYWHTHLVPGITVCHIRAYLGQCFINKQIPKAVAHPSLCIQQTKVFQCSSSIFTNVTASGRGQGALNITGYSTELLDCLVVTLVWSSHQERAGCGSMPAVTMLHFSVTWYSVDLHSSFIKYIFG